MSLSSEEKCLIIDSVAAFAMKMVMSAGKPETEIMADLDDFYNFFCGTLEAAMRDGRREAMVTTLN